MLQQVKEQQNIFEEIYSKDNAARFSFNVTNDPLIRYLRDRRLQKALDFIKANSNGEDIYQWKVLVVCGGVGGEGIFFIRKGFHDVTVSDISENSLQICRELEPKIKTVVLNGEDTGLPENAYDLVIVQDGLHHLPRPTTGFTEMLRTARKGVVVIEPYYGTVGNLIGTEWEVHGDSTNYVYRWNRMMVSQAVKSYLLKEFKAIKVFRLWDHNVVVRKLSQKFPGSVQLPIAKFVYALLTPFGFLGNMMVAVVLKE
ncbi:MAG: class I SAM-dependent methyltransferase [Bacteroidetes bacterium]|nr:class I SAM-dependent methyltransferase [Bacteroidota bacterium]